METPIHPNETPFPTELPELSGSSAEPTIDTYCRNCASPDIEEGYRLALCSECRSKLSAYPVPVWIKVTAVVILALLVTALFRFPSNIHAAISYERGKQAEHRLQYMTAVRQYELAAEQHQDSPIILGRLFIAYYKSGELQKASDTLRRIAGRSPGDKNLTREVNAASKQMHERYYSGKELQAINENSQLTPDARIEQLRSYLNKKPADIPGKYQLADTFFSAKNYDEAEKSAVSLVKAAPDFEPGRLLLAAVYREMGKYDLAVNECQAVLARNTESTDAYYALTRIELKSHHDEQGLAHALTAVRLKPDNPYELANLALAYHYNGKTSERDQLVSALKSRRDFPVKDRELLEDTISGAVQWRN